MIDFRNFLSLGRTDHGWLKAAHHFSFGGYHDPDRMGWGALRVWNDDEIASGAGFPVHPHRDMEIITYVRTGSISHQDSLGNAGRTEAGQVQVMSAGTGITHSEFNAESETTTLFQIWITPNRRGHAPSWGTRPFPVQNRAGSLVTLASGIAGDHALTIQADARLRAGTLKVGQTVSWDLASGWQGYAVLASGRARLGSQIMNARDGVGVRDETDLVFEALEDTEIVVVETHA